MPELPEVETTRRGIAPHIEGRRVAALAVRQPALRWPIPADLGARLEGQTILAVARRAKYLLLHTEGGGTALIHLGMSGSLRLCAEGVPADAHDHVDLVLEGGTLLRYRDQRRFGAWLWADDWRQHPLLASLGPEPLEPGFDGSYLYRLSRRRARVPVKNFIMDSRVVVGVGNIYASEALHMAGIHPRRAAARVGAQRYERLAAAIVEVLQKAIAQGGTTLRDFVSAEGRPGYFRHELLVYGREGEPCTGCGTPLRSLNIGARNSFFCPRCQR